MVAIFILQLMDIVDLLFSPKTTEDHAVYLITFINDHHHVFSDLYPDASKFPKMHFFPYLSKLVSMFSCIDMGHLFVIGQCVSR